jgi:hypothetical protein
MRPNQFVFVFLLLATSQLFAAETDDSCRFILNGIYRVTREPGHRGFTGRDGVDQLPRNIYQAEVQAEYSGDDPWKKDQYFLNIRPLNRFDGIGIHTVETMRINVEPSGGDAIQYRAHQSKLGLHLGTRFRYLVVNHTRSGVLFSFENVELGLSPNLHPDREIELVDGNLDYRLFEARNQHDQPDRFSLTVVGKQSQQDPFVLSRDSINESPLLVRAEDEDPILSNAADYPASEELHRWLILINFAKVSGRLAHELLSLKSLPALPTPEPLSIHFSRALSKSEIQQILGRNADRYIGENPESESFTEAWLDIPLSEVPRLSKDPNVKTVCNVQFPPLWDLNKSQSD